MSPSSVPQRQENVQGTVISSDLIFKGNGQELNVKSYLMVFKAALDCEGIRPWKIQVDRHKAVKGSTFNVVSEK